MKTYRVKITQEDFDELQRLVLSDMPKEAAAFALAGVADHDDGTDIIVRRPVSIPKDCFSLQHELRLEIATKAINGLAALCEANGLGAVLCHSHPGNIPYSASDDHGEQRIFEVLRRFIPSSAPTGSLLFYPDGVRGRVWLKTSEKPIPIAEIIILGRQIKRIRPDASSASDRELNEEMFDRQIRAFGKQGQAMIARSKVGIVGVGGTGSPTAEQVTRLGVRDLAIIDHDHFESSDITRVYGTFPSALRPRRWRSRKIRPNKIDLVVAHLKKINPMARIQAIPKTVIIKDAAAKLLDRDFIFLCTDNHWSRSVVNQIAYQYFVPTINLGARIDAKDGAIFGAVGIIDVLRPDLPCLWCRQFLRADRIAAESMPHSARKSLEREGYVEDIDGHAPSVISITTTLSGMGVTLFLQMVTDFMGPAGEISRLNYNVMDGTVRRGTSTILDECICQKVRGFGDLKSLPVLTGQRFPRRLTYLKDAVNGK